MSSRGPIIVRMHSPSATHGSSGVQCCCCRCCTCINLRFLKTEPGLYKLAEAILGTFCQSLALEYGMAYAGSMGMSYYGFLSTSYWCAMTTILLLFCYVVSEKSFSLVRQSLFETVFNIVAAFCYLSSTSYLGYIVNTILFPLFKSTAYFQAYPAMTGAYLLGTIVGVLHAIDAYKSYKYFKGFR
ncbi:singles bar [Carabus blaptoides fortunei]